MNQIDLLIKDAKIVDGTGATAYKGSLVVNDGKIENISRGDHEKF